MNMKLLLTLLSVLIVLGGIVVAGFILGHSLIAVFSLGVTTLLLLLRESWKPL